jgi:Ydr279p protein family (RNase H2 complex component) wHTH domain
MEDDISTSSDQEYELQGTQEAQLSEGELKVEAPVRETSQTPKQEPLVEDPEISRMKVFFGSVFPKAQKFNIEDPGHTLHLRNLVFDDSTKKIFEVRCFERPGIHFFGQRVLNKGDVFGITPLSGFYLLLPYLWSDLRYNEEKGGKGSLKSIQDLLLEDRSHYKQPYNLKQINPKLKDIIQATLEPTIPILKAVCITQDAGVDLYLKLDRSKLFLYLQKKCEELSTYILEKGHLLEYSLLKQEFKKRDAQEFALEHICGLVSVDIFSDLVKALGLNEAELFKKDENATKRPYDSPCEKEGKIMWNKKVQSPREKESTASTTTAKAKNALTNFFAVKKQS